MQDVKNAIKHLREHQSYPATKADLVVQCNNLSDFSDEDKKDFETRLPEGTYNSADEIIKALAWQEQEA